MRRLVASALALGLASGASAETCVSASFDRPFPGASGVETRYADVPSPRFPGLWQEGRIDGYFYRIWSNEEAVLQSEARRPDWVISVRCDRGGTPCHQMTDGAPPEGALTIAKGLEACLSDPGYTGKAEEKVAAAAAEAETARDTLSEGTPGDAGSTVPCGLAKLPEGPSGFTLQRLIVEAGADPGPLDGFPGRRTRRALVQVLGASAEALTEVDAIEALNQALCNAVE